MGATMENLPEAFGVHKVHKRVANVHSRGSIDPVQELQSDLG